MQMQSALRRTAATVTFVLLTVALAEVGSCVLLRSSLTTLPSRSEIQASLEPPERSEAGPATPDRRLLPEPIQQDILHPYLGFVRNPAIGRQVFNDRVIEEPVNEYGFFGPSPLEARDPGTFSVAITGGSVATDLYLRSSEALRSGLRESLGLSDGRIRILCLALGGMKQPQQLLALVYFLSLGASFDVVINLDGFNEVALPFAENVPAGLPISLPRSWHLYTAPIAEAGSAALLVELAATRQRIERARGFFSREPLRRSSLFLILWNRLHQGLRSDLLALEKRRSDLLLGPDRAHHPSRTRPIEEVLAEAAELWSRSSIQMWKTCRSNGSVYVHVLQPNQYVPRSKPLDARERRIAWPPEDPYRRAAEQGYPLLIVAGERLKSLGVAFLDVTRLFEAETGRIYADHCCHYNQRGNDMLAAEIAGFVAASVEAAGASPAQQSERTR